MAVSQRTYKAAAERLRAYVRDHKMRESKIRNSVLHAICQLPQPFTATQLEEVCLQEHISTGTVYNCLELFTSAQILHVIKRQRGQTVTEYELMSPAQSRVEMICLKCGRVREAHDRAVEQLVQEKKYTNFIPHSYSLFVYGECKMCRLSRKKKEN